VLEIVSLIRPLLRSDVEGLFVKILKFPIVG
jgi:hypothetical protein